MTLYRYYKIDNDIDDTLPVDKRYKLIAVTNNKQLAEDFEMTRNMDKYVKICGDMKSKLCHDYILNNSNEEICEESLFLTYTRGKYNEVYIPHTWDEYERIDFLKETFFSDYFGAKVDSNLFSGEYRHALDILKYTTLFNKEYIDPDIELDVVFDEFAIFVKEFKSELKV